MVDMGSALKRQATTALLVNDLKLSRIAKSVQETDVGITVFLNSTSNVFTGIIKQRYSDFLVNEIDTKGNVVHLIDEGIDLGKSKKEKRMEKRKQDRLELQDKTPEELEQIKQEKKEAEEAAEEAAKSQPKYELSDEHKSELLKALTAEELTSVEELFSNGGNITTTTTFEDKAERTKLHRLIREAFQGKLETVTTEENTFKIALANKNSRQSRPARNPLESINHVDDNGVLNYGLGPFKNYLHFTVYKENRETMEVASTIAKFLRIAPKTIRYAGTKDRRGVTCQRFSIQKGKVARVSSLNKGLFGSVLGGFTYEDEPLSLGALDGNEFLVTVRDVKAGGNSSVEDNVSKSFESLKTKGFINYYGMQRFGSFSVSTHAIGIHLLKDEWKEAVELILSEQEIVVPESVEARKIWAETKDPKQALAKMPRRCVAEHALLNCLSREQKVESDDGTSDYSKNTYFKALMAIPRNLRIMYVHAYQSYIWNVIASKRIEMFGLEVQVGDLVIITDQEKKQKEIDDFEEDVAEDHFVRARALTEDDIATGNYTVYDTVLPMPGFDIKYPENEQLERLFVDTMAVDGLDPHLMARRVREFSLAGSYRNVVSRPKNLSYKVVKYTNDLDPLVYTDLELLRMRKEAEINGKEFVEERYITPVLEEGKEIKTAVIFSVQLGVSSYATMMMRELMKIDTTRFGESMFKREK